ncbi:AAA family ATPase [Burkholderia multivorans]|nr:AAA family ATPase [Burkholderia multivorans]
MKLSAIFICGPSGTGKTTLSKALVRLLVADGHPVCLLDKDSVTDALSHAFMHELTGNAADRDSPAYKEKVRDQEYQCTLEAARDNLELGISCVMPAPWTQELADGRLQNPYLFGDPDGARVVIVWLTLDSTERRRRIAERGFYRDRYKLEHWERFSDASAPPKHENVIVLDAARPTDELALSLRARLLAKITPT